MACSRGAALCLLPALSVWMPACALRISLQPVPMLPYTPERDASCKPGAPDFGDDPNVPILQSLAQHLQVALEQTCTSVFLSCAYINANYAVISNALGGIFRDSGVKESDVQLFERWLGHGLEDLRKTGFGLKGQGIFEVTMSLARPPGMWS
eukprot:gnl/TRDRNA2_/TRDRNA2_172389_c0_seq1.p1 gnl/TRDRNA2_/TRDRNA2_172389_c0~~gnl/TRDRNA2_/TRDRNA2_172389_c0_seq1.p1  ORF type:complete len:152 (+),score=22.03 gnl/TRDRNA2_/TRDRNA2_172389_c0_seq1:93-548(+)